MVVDPPDGRVPLRPEAIAKRDADLALDANVIRTLRAVGADASRAAMPKLVVSGGYN